MIVRRDRFASLRLPPHLPLFRGNNFGPTKLCQAVVAVGEDPNIRKLGEVPVVQNFVHVRRLLVENRHAKDRRRRNADLDVVEVVRRVSVSRPIRHIYFVSGIGTDVANDM